MICPKCGNESMGRFCENCGFQLVRKCFSCGSEIQTDKQYCPNCGADNSSEAIANYQSELLEKKADHSRKIKKVLKIIIVSLCALFLLFLAVNLYSYIYEKAELEAQHVFAGPSFYSGPDASAIEDPRIRQLVINATGPSAEKSKAIIDLRNYMNAIASGQATPDQSGFTLKKKECDMNALLDIFHSKNLSFYAVRSQTEVEYFFVLNNMYFIDIKGDSTPITYMRKATSVSLSERNQLAESIVDKLEAGVYDIYKLVPVDDLSEGETAGPDAVILFSEEYEKKSTLRFLYRLTHLDSSFPRSGVPHVIYSTSGGVVLDPDGRFNMY